MCCGEWVQGPFGLDADTGSGATVRTRRTVLAVVHSVVTGARLADVLPVLASDQRVQVVFSAAPSLFPGGVRDFLHGIGAVTVPWQQASWSGSTWRSRPGPASWSGCMHRWC